MRTRKPRRPAWLVLHVVTLSVILWGCSPTGETGGDDDEHGEHSEDGEHGHDDHGHDDHDEERPEEVAISAEAMERSGIRLDTAASGSVMTQITIPAEIQLNPDQVAHVSTMVEGQVSDIQAVVGDAVVAEQPIATVRSITLGRARAEYERANAMLDVARENYDRQQRLRSEGISSERTLLEAQFRVDEADAERDAARAVLSVLGVRGGSGPEMPLTSPIAGTVIQRHATQGESVTPEDELFVVADLTNVWVIGRVYEQELGQISPGMPATLTLSSYPTRRWEGTVDYISPTADETTRTVGVRVVLDNTEGVLRPGLFGSLRLNTGDAPSTVALVPESAIQTLDNMPTIFVPNPDEENVFLPVTVSLGRSNQGIVEVLDGIQPGDEIVVAGGFLLKSQLIRGELGEHEH